MDCCLIHPYHFSSVPYRRPLRRRFPSRAIPKFTDTVSVYEEGYEPDVIIVGGGLAGLSCARTLHRNSVSFALLEASDRFVFSCFLEVWFRVGGRVKTDSHEGFLLDHGFQIFLTAYPEAQRVYNYEDLRLKSFYNGAMVWWNGNFYRVADPFRLPFHFLRLHQ